MMLMGLRYVRHEVMRANDPAPDIYRISIVVRLMSLPNSGRAHEFCLSVCSLARGSEARFLHRP